MHRSGREPAPNRVSAYRKADIAAHGYDLSLNRYKEIVHDDVEYRSPTAILDELDQIEQQIDRGMAKLRELLV